MRKAGVRACLLVIAASLPQGGMAADYARTLAYEKAIAALPALSAAGETAGDLQAAAAPLGLTFTTLAQKPMPLPALKPGGVSIVAIDLVLSQLALQAGANYHVALRQAQARPEVLLIESGVTSLAALYEAVQAAGLEGALELTANGYVAHLPIAVWSGATLVLEPGERLLLDRAAGAFLLAAGNLAGQDASIASTGAGNARLADFNPFVVVALSGSARFSGMQFTDLGFGAAAPLTGVTIVAGGFYAAGAPSFIRDSRFDDVGSLALIDVADADISANIFTAASGPAILVSGGHEVALDGNVIFAGDTAHGIKVTGAARDVSIGGNIVLGAGLNGIFADAGAAELSIDGNLISASLGSGISIASADCIGVTGNLLLANAQSGLAIRDSAGLSVSGNRLIDNGNAGISVTHQPDFGQIAIAHNELDGNKVGVKGSTTARLVFAANDFRAQAPRLLDGELVQFTDRFLDLGADGQTVIDGLQLKREPALTSSGALRPTSCSFPGDA